MQFEIDNNFQVMMDFVLKKWLDIRKKWDLLEIFIGYCGFVSILG